eukprot:CFRG5621T1
MIKLTTNSDLTEGDLELIKNKAGTEILELCDLTAKRHTVEVPISNEKYKLAVDRLLTFEETDRYKIHYQQWLADFEKD